MSILSPPSPTSPAGLIARRDKTRAVDHLKGCRDRYDVIVIGSGLAGLTAANRLARCGHSVLLLEQHYNFGGLATWFKRKNGHVFDISLHGFPVGMVKTCRKYWSKEIADAIVQLKEIRFDNPQFSISTTFDRDDFTRILMEKFGIERATIDSFFDTARSMNFFDTQKMTTRDLFQKFFPDRTDVWRLLMEPIAYANGSTLEDPAFTYGIVFSNFMSKGVYTFQGGTDQLIKAMKAELLSNNVDLRNHAQVEKINVVVENGVRRATGVVVNGRTIHAGAVLSNAHLLTTIRDLVGEKEWDPDFVDEARAVRVNNSSCQVYIGIKKGETIPEIGDLLFTSTAPELDSTKLTAMETTSRTYSFYYPHLRPGSDRYSVVCSTNANYKDWVDLDEPSYMREKEKLAKDSIDILGKYLPGVAEKVDHVEVSTPKTFQFFTQHMGGASFGTKFEGLKVSQDIPKQINGLFHAGSVGIIMSGWLGAANYGVIVSNEVDRWLVATRKE